MTFPFDEEDVRCKIRPRPFGERAAIFLAFMAIALTIFGGILGALEILGRTDGHATGGDLPAVRMDRPSGAARPAVPKVQGRSGEEGIPNE